MPNIIQPYKHDCGRCKWVGWYHHPGSPLPANVYLCGETVVIRYSDDPPDYWSSSAHRGIKGGLDYVENTESYEAALRAIKAREYIEDEDGYKDYVKLRRGEINA
jgi:hypothetical protein